MTKNASNRYYWRLVVRIGEETISGKAYHYVELSDIRGVVELTIDGKKYTCVGYDTSTENDIPKADDDIIQLGSQTDKDRQYAYIVYVSECKRVDYAGINDYDLASHVVNSFSPRETTVRSDSFNVVSASGTGVSRPIVCDRGEWVSGTLAGHYDRFSYGGEMWLCIVGKGKTTDTMPSDDNPLWIKEVSKGAQGDGGITMVTLSDTGITCFRNGQGTIALRTYVYRDGKDITDSFPPSAFSWERKSASHDMDAGWNARHKNIGRTITVTKDDVLEQASFECVLEN